MKKTLSLYSHALQYFIDKEPVTRIKAGTILFQEGDQVQYVYLLISGTLSVGRVHVKGKEFIMKLLNDEEMVIEYELFKHAPKYYFSAKALIDSEIMMIKRDVFEEYIQSDPAVNDALISWLSTRYLKAQIRCQDLIMNGKKGGLYSILIRLCNTHGVMTDKGIRINLPLTHQEIANLTYGTREVVQRMLKELREQDVITYDQLTFTVKDLNFLKREVDCQNCPYEICGLN